MSGEEEGGVGKVRAIRDEEGGKRRKWYNGM